MSFTIAFLRVQWIKQHVNVFFHSINVFARVLAIEVTDVAIDFKQWVAVSEKNQIIMTYIHPSTNEDMQEI